MPSRPLVAFVVAGLSVALASPAFAQETPRDPSELDEPTVPSAPAAPTAPATPTESGLEPTPRDTLATLREIEARLSVGQPLSDGEQRVLVETVSSEAAPEARALAAAILPWLPPEVAGPALLGALDDADARVRSQAAQGLVALSRRLVGDPRERALRASVRLLDDVDDDVACNAGQLLVALSAPLAVEQISLRAEAGDISAVRDGCFRRLAGLRPRPVSVPPPAPPAPIVEERDATPVPTPEPAPEQQEPDGDLVFIAAAAGAGFVAGGLAPGIAVPARDTLTYTRRRTTHTREETSVATAAATAAVGALALGGGAWALTELAGSISFPAASGVVLASTTGALGGFGLAYAGAFGDSALGLGTVTGGLLGFAAATSLAYLAPPTPADVGFATAVGGQAAVLGTLISFAAVPVGFELVFDRAPRLDFGLGIGLLSGGLATTLALGASPFVEVHPGRVLASSAAGLTGAALGMGLGYLFVPTSVDVRGRIAAGIGAGLSLLGAGLVFVLLPDNWADAVLSPGDEIGRQALVLDDGALRLGLPSVDILPRDEGAAVAIGLLGGRF